MGYKQGVLEWYRANIRYFDLIGGLDTWLER